MLPTSNAVHKVEDVKSEAHNAVLEASDEGQDHKVEVLEAGRVLVPEQHSRL